MWDLSSLTRDQTHIPCIVRRILCHWTTREVPEGNSKEERNHFLLDVNSGNKCSLSTHFTPELVSGNRHPRRKAQFVSSRKPPVG